MVGGRQGRLRLRSSDGTSVRPPKNSRLIKALAEYRLKSHLTWKEIGALCGVNSDTLRVAFLRGTISDRIASIVISSKIFSALKTGGRRA